LARAGAAAEAYHGIYLIFELLLPSRNIMQLYIWWQYLRMRYMLDTTGTPAGRCFAQYIQGLLCTVWGLVVGCCCHFWASGSLRNCDSHD
jgi:hypothetical protein